MRIRPALLALAAPMWMGSCGAAGPVDPARSARPLRVMSMNQCTDQLVLALLPPERIASVSWLARDPSGSVMAAQASRVAVSHAQAEEVLAQRPDLIVTGSFSTPALRSLLRRLHYPLVEVDQAASIPDIRRITRQVAAAVGERARGEAMIADMDGKLATLARDPAPPVRIVAWDRTGFAAGEGTLYDTLLAAAGVRNVVREAMMSHYRRPDVEVLLKVDPALLVQGALDPHGASLGDDAVRHALVRRRWGARTLIVPQRDYACGTPMLADAALRLRARLRAARLHGGRAG